MAAGGPPRQPRPPPPARGRRRPPPRRLRRRACRRGGMLNGHPARRPSNRSRAHSPAVGMDTMGVDCHDSTRVQSLGRRQHHHGFSIDESDSVVYQTHPDLPARVAGQCDGRSRLAASGTSTACQTSCSRWNTPNCRMDIHSEPSLALRIAWHPLLFSHSWGSRGPTLTKRAPLDCHRSRPSDPHTAPSAARYRQPRIRGARTGAQ